LVEIQFYWILEWLLQLVSSDHLFGKLFCSLLLWRSVSLSLWDVFLICSKMLGPLYIPYLLLYIFLLGELNSLLLRNIKEIDYFSCFYLFCFVFVLLAVVRGEIIFVCLSCFGIVTRRLLSCFFKGVVSLLVLEFSIYYPF